jgi:hypothetical protein
MGCVEERPAKISFDEAWDGTPATAQIEKSTQQFKGTFFITGATIAWSAEQSGFRFQSDTPPDPKANLVSLLGRDSGGIVRKLLTALRHEPIDVDCRIFWGPGRSYFQLRLSGIAVAAQRGFAWVCESIYAHSLERPQECHQVRFFLRRQNEAKSIFVKPHGIQ